MKTKGKLALIVGIIGACLLLTALFLTWNMVAAYRLVEAIAPAIDTFTALNETQARLYRQQHTLARFAVNGEPAARRELDASRDWIGKQLQVLLVTVKRQQARGVAGEDDVAANLERVRAGYGRYLEQVDRCVRAKIAGRSDEALNDFATQVAPSLETELFPILNQMRRDEIAEIHEFYHEIFLRLGGLPWIAVSGAHEVEVASSGVDYDYAVSNAGLGLYREVTELTEFMLQAESREWKEFWGQRLEMQRLWEEWRQVILRQQAMGIAGEDEDAKRFAEIRAQYEVILPKMEQSVSFRVSMGRSAGLEYVDQNVMAPLNGRLFPALTDISGYSREEVKRLHGELLRAVLIGGVGGLLGIIIFSIVLVLLAVRLSNGIVDSLGRLKAGTEIVKGGDLTHRIDIAGRDEFSELAASFNVMTSALKAQNDELRSFVFSVAHDLRAPLVNLKGFAGELRRDLTTITPELLPLLATLNDQERQRLAVALQESLPEALEFIDSSAQKLDSLVNSILRLSRIGMKELNPEEIDTEKLVHATLQNFAHAIHEKRIAVTVGPLPVVFADRLVMEQCVANLLDNAFKYLVPGRPGTVSITAEVTDKEAVLYFQDNGRGIAVEDLAKVFEIFRRAGRPDTPGEGMGLAFVRALIKRHGGNVWCESKLGEGSTFCLSIPVVG